MGDTSIIRIAAVGDLHCSKTSQGAFHALFAQVTASADILVFCGDFTDYGLPDEARILSRELTAGVKVPVVGVLGNHDFESGKQDEVRQILTDAGIAVLDGDATEIKGVGFAGVKGFAGGFGPRALGPWGEHIIKQFVREAVDEALKLESALARIRTKHTIAVLHYSPIQGTVEGEPLEIYPFLGCSRLEEPLVRYPVTAVFHGHAHRGQPEGRTRAGTPVYNVSMPLLSRTYPDRMPFRLLELTVETPAATPPVDQPPRAEQLVK
jgi:Icc-related predicted phosphoesterase